MFDLEAYLRRIGLSGSPGVAEIHRARVTSIPFESLDPQRGVPVSLAPADIAAKLVTARRGGYCFEQNLLLAGALRELGAEVEFHMARVLLGADPEVPRARSHLLLSVRIGGRHLHADAGFGSGTLLEPIPWGPGEEIVQAGWRQRVIERGGEYVLQDQTREGWRDLYAFLPHPVAPAEIEVANWWTSTHPDSRFVTGFLVSRQWADGRRLVISDWGGLALIESSAEHEERQALERPDVPAVLAERFDLPGFELAADGRLVLGR